MDFKFEKHHKTKYLGKINFFDIYDITESQDSQLRFYRTIGLLGEHKKGKFKYIFHSAYTGDITFRRGDEFLSEISFDPKTKEDIDLYLQLCSPYLKEVEYLNVGRFPQNNRLVKISDMVEKVGFKTVIESDDRFRILNLNVDDLTELSKYVDYGEDLQLLKINKSITKEQLLDIGFNKVKFLEVYVDSLTVPLEPLKEKFPELQGLILNGELIEVRKLTHYPNTNEGIVRDFLLKNPRELVFVGNYTYQTLLYGLMKHIKQIDGNLEILGWSPISRKLKKVNGTISHEVGYPKEFLKHIEYENSL